jgi:hypothetical protein
VTDQCYLLCRSGDGSAAAAGAVDDPTDGLLTASSPSGLPMPEG